MLTGECIEVWMLVQRKWMYLESIFVGSDDIRHQLPAEARRFDGIDKQWQRIMTETARNVNVLDACSADGRLQNLQVCKESCTCCALTCGCTLGDSTSSTSGLIRPPCFHERCHLPQHLSPNAF